ncbi:MAG: autotransporter domain-containing protein [Alphaproteobacteria bacterium]|nr:autotransporter domain-containing protein [Alphaproteobacteria bacterium]
MALWLAASAANAQDVFVVDDQQTTTNGGNTVLDGDTLIVTDTGSIDVTGNDVDAMEGTGNTITLDNRGRLTTGGQQAYAQNIEGDFGTIANSGAISTEGDRSPAQSLEGDFGSLNNSGTITTWGHVAHGQTISRNSVGGAISNTGTIMTFGPSAFGQEGTSGLKVVNSGVITTRGRTSFGQAIEGGHLINIGSITVYGADSVGQRLGGRDGTLTNSGRLVSVNGRAISFDDRRTGHILNLLAPGFIGGEIRFDTAAGTPTAVNVTTGPSHSILWTLEGDKVGGAPNFSGPVPWFYDAATQTVATFDPTLLATETDALGDLTALLSRVGRGALDRSGADLAVGGNSPLAYQREDDRHSEALQATERAVHAYGVADRMGQVWATGLGGRMDFDASATTLDSTTEHIGFAAGYTWQHSAGATLNAMGGYVFGKAKADAPWAQSFDHDTHAVFAGLGGEQDLGHGAIQLGLTAGYQWVDHNRFVNDNLAPLGESWVTANYGGFFVSPELAIATDIAMANGITLTPNAGVRYAAQWLGGYSESGAVNPAANATVGTRFVGVLEARAGLEASRAYGFGILSGRIGYLGRWNGGNDEAGITLNGSTQDVASGYEALNAVTVGATLRSDIGATGFFELDADYLYSDSAHGFGGLISMGRVF